MATSPRPGKISYQDSVRRQNKTNISNDCHLLLGKAENTAQGYWRDYAHRVVGQGRVAAGVFCSLKRAACLRV